MDNLRTDQEEEYDLGRVRAAIEVLREHFDTVQIFVTRKDPSGTTCCQLGIGNWFARYGHIRLWVLKEEHLDARDRTKDKEKEWE